MIRSSMRRRTECTFLSALAAFGLSAHGEGAAEDAFDRPISLIMPRAPLDHFCREVSKQIALPVEIQRRD